MVLEALIALLMLVIVFGLSLAAFPLLAAGAGAVGSLLAGAASRIADLVSDLRSGQRPKARVLDAPTASGK